MGQGRKKALDELLKPIKWDWSSSVSSRQKLVMRRHREVGLVLPFLNRDETRRAKQWLKDEAHRGLWD